MTFRVGLLAAVCLVSLQSLAFAAGKLALVVGNGAYQHAAPLPNPTNDAGDIANTLQGMGFEVITALDATKQDMELKIREFAEKADQADVTLFFYAGHGMQVNGINYLVPVDAKLASATALDFETINSDTVLNYMSTDSRVGLVFLDACRDNPLSRSFRAKSRSGAVGAGLAAPKATSPNLLIAYATAPGELALDGNGRNSPFTTALLKHLPQPKKELRALLTEVKGEVQSLTNREQIPWSQDNFTRNVYLSGEDAAPVEVVSTKQDQEPPLLPKTDGDTEAKAAWEAVKDQSSPAMFDVVANRYPNSLYGELARSRAEELRAEENLRKADAAKKQALLNKKNNPPLVKVKPQVQEEVPVASPAGEFRWGVILGSFPKAQVSKARARLKEARANGLDASLVNTDKYSRLTPGLFSVIIGANSRDEALQLAEEAKMSFGDAYAKQLQ
jgi:uncharacterized caspase-like protein